MIIEKNDKAEKLKCQDQIADRVEKKEKILINI